MTTGQKFKVAVRSSFDYVQYPWYAAVAGISQAENKDPAYGQGAQGYAKRYGAAFAEGTIENFMVNAIVPSVLRTDPRYYQLGRESFWHRTSYSLSRLFITRTDSGRNTFNFAEIGGSGMAAAISTYGYHPEADKTFSNTGTVWGTQVAYDAMRIVLNEFWPDIRRKFHQDKTQQPQKKYVSLSVFHAGQITVPSRNIPCGFLLLSRIGAEKGALHGAAASRCGAPEELAFYS